MLGGVVDLNSANCTHLAFVSKKTIQYCFSQPVAYQKMNGPISFASNDKTAIFLQSSRALFYLDVSIVTRSIGNNFTLIGLGTSVVARNLSVYISSSSGYCNGILPAVSLAQLRDCRIEVHGGDVSYGLARMIRGNIDLDGVFIKIVGKGAALGERAIRAVFRMVHCRLLEHILENEGGIVKHVSGSQIAVFVDSEYTDTSNNSEFY